MVVTFSRLAISDPSKPFVAKTDTSDFAIEAILIQGGKPVAFESKKLNPAQCRYSNYEKELYIIIHALNMEALSV